MENTLEGADYAPVSRRERAVRVRWAAAVAAVLIGLLVLAANPTVSRAATVWCSNGNAAVGSGYTSYVVAYADPACSGVSHYHGYDHYDVTSPSLVMDYIYLDFLRIWRCGSLIYTQSDGADPDVYNQPSRNIWKAWYSNYLAHCGPQSDHQSHYYRTNGLNAWAYTNVN